LRPHASLAKAEKTIERTAEAMNLTLKIIEVPGTESE